MKSLLIKTAIRSLFVLTSRPRAMKQAQRLLDGYVKLAEGLDGRDGSRRIEVPPMLGVDEDMRKWSFYMILEHNSIVSRIISATIQQLVRGEPLSGAATIDPKTGVMPSMSSGDEQVARFQDSVEDHLKVMITLGRLRGTQTAPHPIFGDFDAHKWLCMFSFHLKVHYRQAEYILRATKVERGR